jgi:hypothetical protein
MIERRDEMVIESIREAGQISILGRASSLPLAVRLTRVALVLALISLSSTIARAGTEIDWDDQHTESVSWWGEAAGRTHSESCDTYENGAIRSWYLKERNIRDFRKSYVFCRDIQSDGSFGDDYSKGTHFSYSGSGTTGNSSMPLEVVYADRDYYESALPVGVQTFWHFPSFTVGVGTLAKLEDVNILLSTTDDVMDRTGIYSTSGKALGHDGTSRTLVCDPGYVMTGVRVRAQHDGVGGRNQAEIRAVKIECSKLVLRYTAVVK